MEKPVKKAAPKRSQAASAPTPTRLVAKPRAAANRSRTAENGKTPSRLAPVYELNHDAIAAVAYELFERSGQPHGRDVEFWLEAERRLKVRREA